MINNELTFTLYLVTAKGHIQINQWMLLKTRAEENVISQHQFEINT